MAGVEKVFETFFEEVVPPMFKAVTEAFPVQGMEGTTFTMQVNLTGEGGVTYGLVIKDASEIEVKKGGVENAMLTVEIPASIFVDLMKNTVSAPLGKMYEAARETQGTMAVEASPGEGKKPFQAKFTFNGAEEPQIRLSSDMATFLKLMNGEESPPVAFMQGNLKIDGNMMFGMELMNKFSFIMPGAS